MGSTEPSKQAEVFETSELALWWPGLHTLANAYLYKFQLVGIQPLK